LIKVHLPLPPNFSFDAVVRSHGWYNLPPFEYDRERGELRTFVELLPLPPGEGRGEGHPRADKAASITFRTRQGRLEASSDGLGREELRRTARRVFSLDLNLDPFAAALAGEPLVARALARRGGRILRAPTLFEDAVKILFTTNCSWAATRGMVTRLIAEGGVGGRAFPTARRVARLTIPTLKKKVRCGYRAEALAQFARRVSSGRLDLSAWERWDRPAEEIRAEILAERGFGPYAAEGLLRILGRHDFLALDSWTRQKYRQLHPGPARSTDRAIARRYARFGSFRGLALWLELTEDWHAAEEQVWP
jgi:3-methyladenine DNA glycosylase/8-oxoguanine DNA glycosylase